VWEEGKKFFPHYTLKLVKFDEFVFLGFPRSGDLHLSPTLKHDFVDHHRRVSCFIAIEKLKTNSFPRYSPQTANNGLNSRSLKEMSCLRLCIIREISNSAEICPGIFSPNYSDVFP
jgi:hypothetical protein